MTTSEHLEAMRTSLQGVDDPLKSPAQVSADVFAHGMAALCSILERLDKPQEPA